jgi:hypothetical protein
MSENRMDKDELVKRFPTLARLADPTDTTRTYQQQRLLQEAIAAFQLLTAPAAQADAEPVALNPYWLIERGSPAEWLEGIDLEIPEWTQDVSEAMRGTKEQMQNILDGYRMVEKFDARIAEHVDVTDTAPPSGVREGMLRAAEAHDSFLQDLGQIAALCDKGDSGAAYDVCAGLAKWHKDEAEALRAETEKLPQGHVVVPVGWWKKLKDVLTTRFPRCLDCADHDGICPHSELPCRLDDMLSAAQEVKKS